jgi:hypothetical protein
MSADLDLFHAGHYAQVLQTSKDSVLIHRTHLQTGNLQPITANQSNVPELRALKLLAKYKQTRDTNVLGDAFSLVGTLDGPATVSATTALIIATLFHLASDTESSLKLLLKFPADAEWFTG